MELALSIFSNGIIGVFAGMTVLYFTMKLISLVAEHMEAMAAAGEWSEVENLAIRLRSAIMNVPEGERRGLLVQVKSRCEKVAQNAEVARQEVTGRMSAIRRGQVATKAYELR